MVWQEIHHGWDIRPPMMCGLNLTFNKDKLHRGE